MKKKVLIGVLVLLVIVVLILIVFFLNSDNEKDKGPVNSGGMANSGGNIVNSGLIAENDEYVFISSVA